MTIASIYGRVPTLLSSRIQLNTLNSTNADLLRVSAQLTANTRLLRPSDDAIASSVVSTIDALLERDTQRNRNMDHASSVMNSMDATLGELSNLVNEAKSIALEQVQSTADAGTRSGMADVVDQMLTQLYAAMNREFAGVHYFGGGRAGSPPVETFFGGYRYTGDTGGLYTDLGPELGFPITLSADEAVGSLSGRVQGDVDLDARLTATTFVRDLRGPMSDRSLGSLEIAVPSGTPTVVSVDLSDAETIGDVALRIESAVRDADPAAFTGVWGTGVTVSGDRLSFDMAAGKTLVFADGPIGETATALGLSGVTYNTATSTNTAATAGLDPRVTDRTLLSSLDPATALSYGDITFSNSGRTGTVTISAGMTVGELREAVDRLDLGIRLEIDASGNTLNTVNEVAGMTLSVTDGAGAQAATTLGIRSLKASTSLGDFNNGRGVEIADGEIDPTTGLPNTDRNVDFRVTLSDGSTTFDVDLRPQDVTDLNALLARINSESGGVSGFTAALSATQNSIVFSDSLGGGTAISVTSLNGYAAEDLGLLDGTTGTGDQLISSDRSGASVDSLFTTLVELRDALETDDERGIWLAGEKLDADAERLTRARGLVGGRGARVESAQVRLGESMLLDRNIKSGLQDLEFTEATTRLNMLTTQLQAGYQVTSLTSQLSLLNFLG